MRTHSARFVALVGAALMIAGSPFAGAARTDATPRGRSPLETALKVRAPSGGGVRVGEPGLRGGPRLSIDRLRAIVSAADPIAASLARDLRAEAATIPSMTVDGPNGDTVILRLAPPSVFDVSIVAEILLFHAGPRVTGYLVTDLAQQNSWYFALSPRLLAPGQIATELPHAGRWTVRIIAEALHRGALPTMTAGSAPAYDDLRAGAVRIEFSLRPVPGRRRRAARTNARTDY